MSETSMKCTNCSEHVSPSFLSEHVCGENAGGMAGVGRRAFKHLMIGTPPLSPLSFEYGLRTPSPLSPRIATPTSPYLFPFPYPPHATPTIRPQQTLPPLSIPESISVPHSIRTPSHSPTPKSPLSQVMVAPVPDSRTPKLPFFEKYKSNTTASRSPPQQTSQSQPQTLLGSSFRHQDEEEETTLAYDKDIEDPPPSPTSTSSHSVYSNATRLTRDFLSSPPPPPLPPPLPLSPPSNNVMPMSPPRRSHTNPTAGPRGGTAGVPSPFGPSSPPLGTMRSISDAKQHHHSRRPRDSDSDPDVGSGSTLASSLSSQISNGVTTAATTPSPPGSAVKKPRVRICVKCDVRIENGRWIRMDGGKGILCETCWKNMYLPRCRRCSKVIETAAVYSSDGQLKGKYHKHCFTCTICDAPFQSNTFWIYQGQPMCEYHYHESNHSLCAAKDCHKPIEGPCAITEGDVKYHPACLICSTPGCTERLEEYWEIEGRMLCERHAKEIELAEPLTNPSAGTAPTLATATKRSSPPSVRAIPRMFRPMDPSQRLQKRTTKLITIQSALAF